MDVLTTIVVLIPSVLSLCVSGIYAYIALKKVKEPPKDEVWETATRIICSTGKNFTTADDFAELYEQLKLFKDNGCSIDGEDNLFTALDRKKGKVQSLSGTGSTPRL